MFFKIMRTRKGFTLVELMIVVAIMSILVAVGVPVFSVALEGERKKDCKNQATVIQALVEEAMYGMLDNGARQEKIIFSAPDNVYQSDRYAVYGTDIKHDGISGNADDAYIGKTYFALDDEKNEAHKCQPFTLGDLRGGYRDNKYEDYDTGFAEGHYLKKAKYSSDINERGTDKNGNEIPVTYFYQFLANQEIPVCPFADLEDSKTDNDYFYLIFEDGSVLCTCPKCHE